jgi:dolichol-phosphate mannosyltransferase
MDLSVIIPCYNEVDNVVKLQDELFPLLAKMSQNQAIEVIFVDDGSTDGTLDALKRAFGDPAATAPVQVAFQKHPKNLGLGAAIRTGFTAAEGNLILTTDSDGTYRFEEIPQILSYLTPDVDMVTASPYHPKGGVKDVPGYRLILSRGSSLIYRLLVNWHLHTYTSLFRIYRQAVIKCVPFKSTGFLAGTEILVNGMLMGFKTAEYPSVLHSRAAGASKAKIMRTIRAHLGFQWHIALYRLGLTPKFTVNRINCQQDSL